MEQEKMQHFKTRLETELQQVRGELESLGVRDRSTPGGWEPTSGDIDPSATEPDELANRMETFEEHQSELPEIEKHFRNITRALQKIESGAYGMCEISGEPIEMERLEINPSARTCMAHLEEEGTLPE